MNAEGRRQSQAIGNCLRQRLKLDAVYSSPLQRATETAEPVAGLQNLPVQTDARITEVEFGDWTGRTFEELHTFEEWHRYNSNRSLRTAPGGESLMQVQARAWDHLSEITARHKKDETIALVTHADVVRSLLVLFLGMPLDHLLRLAVDPASLTDVTLGGAYPVIHGVNLPACQ